MTTFFSGEPNAFASLAKMAQHETYYMHCLMFYPEPLFGGSPPASDRALIACTRVFATKAHTHDKCSVCLAKYFVNVPLLHLPCQHFFHVPCVSQWLHMHNTCPTCRYALPTGNKNYDHRT